MPYVGKVNVGIFADVKQFLWGMKQAGLGLRALQKTGKTVSTSLATVGKTMTAVGIGMTILAGFAVKAAAAEEDSFTRATKVIQGFNIHTIEGQKAMALAREKSVELGVAVEELHKVYFRLLSSGKDLTESTEMFSKIVDFATVSEYDFEEATEVVLDTMTALNIPTSQLSETLDKLAFAANQSNLRFGDMFETLRKVMGVASGAGISLEGLATGAWSAARAGIKSSLAGTQLRMILLNLLAPAGRAQKRMNQLGLSFGEVDEAGRKVIAKMRLIGDQLLSLEAAGKGNTKEAKNYENQLNTLGKQLRHHVIVNKSFVNIMEEVNTAISKLPVGVQDAAKAEIAGRRAASLFNQVLKDTATGGLRDFENGVISASGVVDDMVKRIIKPFNAQIKRVAIGFRVAGAAIARPFLDNLTKSVKGLADWLGKADKWSESNREIAAGIFMIGPAILAIRAAMFAWSAAIKPVILGMVNLIKITSVGLAKVLVAIGPVAAGLLALGAVAVTVGLKLKQMGDQAIKALEDQKKSAEDLKEYYEKMGASGEKAAKDIQYGLSLIGDEVVFITDKEEALKATKAAYLYLVKKAADATEEELVKIRQQQEALLFLRRSLQVDLAIEKQISAEKEEQSMKTQKQTALQDLQNLKFDLILEKNTQLKNLAEEVKEKYKEQGDELDYMTASVDQIIAKTDKVSDNLKNWGAQFEDVDTVAVEELAGLAEEYGIEHHVSVDFFTDEKTMQEADRVYKDVMAKIAEEEKGEAKRAKLARTTREFGEFTEKQFEEFKKGSEEILDNFNKVTETLVEKEGEISEEFKEANEESKETTEELKGIIEGKRDIISDLVNRRKELDDKYLSSLSQEHQAAIRNGEHISTTLADVSAFERSAIAEFQYVEQEFRRHVAELSEIKARMQALERKSKSSKGNVDAHG